MAITAPVLALSPFAKSITLSIFSSVTLSAASASTPFAEPLPVAINLISDILPLITENFTLPSSSKSTSFLFFAAPAPTGSRTTGCPIALFLFPALSMASTRPSSILPMFITNPLHAPVISSTSSGCCAIVGEPPHARVILAQSLAVTIFDILCTTGAFDLLFSKILSANSKAFIYFASS